MDERTVQANIKLYDSHAPVQHQSDRQMMRQRNKGRAIQLKQYHNAVKAKLLQLFAENKDSLLDMCCGRGGDINKWVECNIRKVKGLDISPLEIVEAVRRFHQVKKRKNTKLEATFNHVTCLGTKEITWDCQYDVVTCMFAIHYFFVSEQAIKMFLKNVATALKPGGYFIATFPSGKQVLKMLNQRDEFRSPMLYLRKHWKGKNPSKPFGEAFECAITDTVTKAENEGEIVASLEYLVFFNAIEALAKEVNLKLVKNYGDHSGNALFQDADVVSGFKHFKPPFDDDEPDLRGLKAASELYVATVFQMGEESAPEAAKDTSPKNSKGPESDAGPAQKKQKV